MLSRVTEMHGSDLVAELREEVAAWLNQVY